METEDTFTFQPPSSPPPLLTQEEVAFLSLQGWLPLRLPVSLSSTLQQVSTEAAQLFDHDADRKLELYPPSNGTECGYYIVPDEKEYVTFRHSLHRESPLERHVAEAWKQAASFLHRILCDLSNAHGIDIPAWDPLINSSLQIPADNQDLESTISLMRVFRYMPGGSADQHTDVGLLTLCVGDASGLQVVDQSQETKRWLSPKWPIVLIGDMTSALLDGRVKAGIHRVVKNPAGRGSVVFALRPRLKGEINLHKFGGEGVVDAKDYFHKIKSTKYNINATQELREKLYKERQAGKPKV